MNLYYDFFAKETDVVIKEKHDATEMHSLLDQIMEFDTSGQIALQWCWYVDNKMRWNLEWS